DQAAIHHRQHRSPLHPTCRIWGFVIVIWLGTRIGKVMCSRTFQYDSEIGLEGLRRDQCAAQSNLFLYRERSQYVHWILATLQYVDQQRTTRPIIERLPAHHAFTNFHIAAVEGNRVAAFDFS